MISADKSAETFGGVAHLGERLNGIQEVESSILFVSTKKRKNLETMRFQGFFITQKQTRYSAWILY